ncbi:BsuPI-related putative proteinase inhibitor [Neobacillus sedimentimangrovi]|nr:BsuPI-related putative proteinase inhibitor [Neobacillus sedimentimangrovi]
MRIILCAIMLFFSTIIRTEAAGGWREKNNDLNVNVTPGPERVEIELVLQNKGKFPLHYEFPTSQYYELVITNQEGEEVYRFSKGRLFLQAIHMISLKPKETITWKEYWNYQLDGKRVPSGKYTLLAQLKPIRLNDKPIKDHSNLTKSLAFLIPEENTVFRNIMVSGTKGKYLIKGEVRPQKSIVYYSVEDGHVEYIQEHPLKVLGNRDEWTPFQLTIDIPKDKLPQNASLLLNLYGRDHKGQIEHMYPIVLEKFK